MSEPGGDFEFERRFFVRELPWPVLDAPALIVQSYFLADEGYALRVRAQAGTTQVDLSTVREPGDELALLDEHADSFDFCAVTVKSPMVGGTRYEAEREIDVGVGLQLVRRGGRRVVKQRYAVWLGEDGWIIDVFAAANRPLVIAEVERGGPVVDLVIPSFCVTEVTDDARFANDALSVRPFGTWSADFDAELAARGPRFLEGFGRNRSGGD